MKEKKIAASTKDIIKRKNIKKTGMAEGISIPIGRQQVNTV
jgi:hypothetical protein